MVRGLIFLLGLGAAALCSQGRSEGRKVDLRNFTFPFR